MKKFLSIVLSVILILGTMSVLMSLPAMATGTQVSITAAEGGYVLSNTAVTGSGSTISARPYYGNTFKGWYLKGTDNKVSGNADYSGEITGDLEARFNVYNQILDGSFESGTTVGLEQLKQYSGSAAVNASRQDAIVKDPSNNTALHNNVLHVKPTTTSTTSKYLVNIPAKVEKNKTYVLHFSYYVPGEKKFAYLGFDVIANTQPWVDNTKLAKWSMFWKTEGRNKTNNSWSGAGKTSTSSVFFAKTINSNVDINKEEWVDVWAVIETGSDASLFGTSNTADAAFVFGVENNVLIDYYLDNVSITEASATAFNELVVQGDGNGTAIAVDKKVDSVFYLDYADASGSCNGDNYNQHIVANSTMYPQMATGYTYKATPNNGFEFVSWTDAAGNVVSTNETETFYSEGTYTANFALAAGNTEGGYLVKDKTANTVTAVTYYGNNFLGWYDADNNRVSTEATISRTTAAGLTAKFQKYNLVDNGDFSSEYVNYETKDNDSKVVRMEETDAFGNKNYYLRLTDTTTGRNKFEGFSWKFTLKQGKKYIISYDLRESKSDAGKSLSDPGVSFRRQIRYWNGTSFVWHDTINFAAQERFTIGTKNFYENTQSELPGSYLPSSGDTLNSSGMFTTYITDSNGWINTSFLVDTTTLNVKYSGQDHYLLTEDDPNGEVTLAIVLGLNQAGSMALDIDNIVVSEYTEKVTVSVGAAEDGCYYINRPASTPVLPATYTAIPADSYKFVGWYDGETEVSTENPIAAGATALTPKFEYVEDPNRYTATAEVESVNGNYGGYISGDKVAENNKRNTVVTFKAVPYGGNIFAGWYDKATGKLVSDNAVLEHKITENVNFVAKFNFNNKFVDAGYDNTPAGTSIWGTDKDWYFADPSVTGSSDVTINKNASYSGDTSINVYAPSVAVRHSALSVEAGKTYHFGVAWAGSGSGVTPDYIKVLDAANGNVLATINDFPTDNSRASGDLSWKKAFVNFNTGSSTSVVIEVFYSANTASLYLDDFVLYDTSATPFIIESNLGMYGDVYPGYLTTDAVQNKSYSTDVTVTAVAYDRNRFIGWYECGMLVSSDATYTFTADHFTELTAEFEVKNFFKDSGIENTEKGVSLSHNLTDWNVNEGQYNNWRFDVTATEKDTIPHLITPHSGNTMLRAFHRGADFSTKVDGLKEKTNYVLSFYWYMPQIEACSFTNVRVNGVQENVELARGMGGSAAGEWIKVDVPFYTALNTEVELVFNFSATSGNVQLYLDDLAIYESNVVGIYAGDGGQVSSSITGTAQTGDSITAILEPGDSFTATAIPNAGNTFKGWYNYLNANELISTNTTLVKNNVTEPMYVVAYFEGANVEPINHFVDGDFENNCFEGIIFTHPFWESDWCTYAVVGGNGSTITPVSGDRCLKVSAQSRYSNIVVNNLKPRTEYTLSFWIAADDYVALESMYIGVLKGEYSDRVNQTTHDSIRNTHQFNWGNVAFVDSEVTGYYMPYDMQCGNWKRVEISFDTANRSSVFLHFSMSKLAGSGALYFDDMRITEGSSYTETVANGSFDTDNTNGWEGGAFTTVTEGTNKYGVVSGEIHNALSLYYNKPYTVKFKAKAVNGTRIAAGLTAGGYESLTDSDGKLVTTTNTSYAEFDLTSEWAEYSFDVHTLTSTDFKLFFKALDGSVAIDDVTVVTPDHLIDVQKFTFEDNTDNSIVRGSVKTGTVAYNDKFYKISTDVAKSGTKSLMLSATNLNPETSDEANAAAIKDHPLTQVWTKLDLQPGKTYTVLLYAKAKTAGTSFYIDVTTTAADWSQAKLIDREVELTTTDWTKLTYTFTAPDMENKPFHAQFIINAIDGKTTSDIYFDDVLVSECSAAITDTNPTKTYTHDISWNVFSNYSFEKDGDVFRNYIKNGDATQGNRYITVKAGDKIIVPVKTKIGYINSERASTYTFAADVKGSGNANGFIGLAYSPDGSERLTNANGNPVSLTLSTDGKWKRSGYTFKENCQAQLYLVIECTVGTFDVDYLSLFNVYRSYENDTHDYTINKFQDVYDDMDTYNKGNYIAGTINDLPSGSYVVLVGDKSYKSEVDSEGNYEIVRVAEGTYTMYIAAGGCDTLTMWGDIAFDADGKLSGLACERLSGTALEVLGEGVRNGAVKLTDEDTGYSYLTVTDSDGQYTAYILDCSWFVEGTTKESDVLSSAGITMAKFDAKTALNKAVTTTMKGVSK